MYGNRPIQPLIVLVALAALFVVANEASAQWLQWGGPHRNFTVEAAGLADQWPESGPPRIWERELGEGYTPIVCDGTALYTMYRKASEPDREVVIALDAATGKTLWESGWPSLRLKAEQNYAGPNASPLIVEERLYTLGLHGLLTCYNKQDGVVLWQKDLPVELQSPTPPWGFSPGLIAYHNLVIVPVGCMIPGMYSPPPAEGRPREFAPPSGRSLVALDQETGEFVWKNLDFQTGHSSPILIQFNGRDMLIVFTCMGVTGVDPRDGKVLWDHPIRHEDADDVIVTPVWNGTDRLFLAAEQHGFVLKLSQADDQYRTEELWRDQKIALGIGMPILIDDMLVGSRYGRTGFLLGVDFQTGKRLWYDRTLGQASLIFADNKLILLDIQGVLALATATRAGVTIHARCQLLHKEAFTPPTLVGTTLYLRDQMIIMALDLH